MTQQLKDELCKAHQGLIAAMKTAVQTELDRTVQRWLDKGRPDAPPPWLRNSSGSREDEDILLKWTFLGKGLLCSDPWKAAVAETLYKIALDAAHTTEATNPGLRLHKGIDYFSLGMAQFLQGRYEEGSHNILIAIEEDRAAGLDDKNIVAKSQLDQHIIPWMRSKLGAVAAECRKAGHAFVTNGFVNRMLIDMGIDQKTQQYRPTWLLWFYSSLRKTCDFPGESPLTTLRRMEALQDLTFLYEAALREKLETPTNPLKLLNDIVKEVCSVKAYPNLVPGRQATPNPWNNFANFNPHDPNADADTKLTNLQAETFGDISSTARFVSQALLTVGLVRNMVHHRVDLNSIILNTQYEWVLKHVLAAILLSW